LLDGILPLLHLLADDLRRLRVIELSCGGFFDRGIFQRGFQHPEHAKFRRIFGAHGLFEIGIDALG
jgi:hypothetical protein